MKTQKFGLVTSAVFLGVALTGCVADVDIADDEMGADVTDEVAEVSQALDTCTPIGTGGGTWGDVITLCRDANNALYVKKRTGTFTSSGTMALKTWVGTIYTTNVFVGQSTVYFGKQLPSWYRAVYTSNAPGTAYTGELQVK